MIPFYAFGSEDGKEVKLGVSDNPAKRKEQHENNNGRIEPLTTLFTWRSSESDEATMKAFFAPYRSRAGSTEWFNATVPLVRNWLRWMKAEPFTGVSLYPNEIEDYPVELGTRWLPAPGRETPAPPEKNDEPFFSKQNGTWDDLETAFVMEGDYYTPPNMLERVPQSFWRLS